MNKKLVNWGLLVLTFIISFYIFNLLPLIKVVGDGSPFYPLVRWCSLNYLYCYSDIGDFGIPNFLKSQFLALFVLPIVLPTFFSFLVFKLSRRESPVKVAFVIPAVILAGAVLMGYFLLRLPSWVYQPEAPKQSVLRPSPLPTSCKSEPGGKPVITSLSSSSGPIGTVLEIRGCDLSGFEGDLDIYFERADGHKIMLTDNFGSYPKTAGSLIKVIVKEPCQQGETVYGRYSGIPAQCNYVALTPGLYKIYTEPWGKRSNTISFTIQ